MNIKQNVIQRQQRRVPELRFDQIQFTQKQVKAETPAAPQTSDRRSLRKKSSIINV